MQGDEQVRESLERAAKAVAARSNIGRGVASTKAVLRPGLDCTVTEGAHSLKLAMSPKYGGTGDGPNPGVLGRAALASCLAITYGMWAARLGVPFDSLEVDVEADYDVRGELGVDDTVRYGTLAGQIGIKVEALKTEVSRLRKQYSDVLKDEVAQTVARPTDVKAELGYLFDLMREQL